MHLQQTSVRVFPAVSFGRLCIECSLNRKYGINCRAKLGAKLLDLFFQWRRQVSPQVKNATHRFFDGEQHLLYRNFTIGSRHYRRRRLLFHFANLGSISIVSATKTARSFASDSMPLAMAKKGPLEKRAIHSAGSTGSTPFFFTKTTMNFAGLVVLALRPTVWTSSGPS